MGTRLERRVVVKTANYPINPALDRAGTVFTNRGATAGVTFTLPAPTSALRGWWFIFKGVANFGITVQTAVADTLVTLGDNAADSLAMSTASQMTGGEMEVFCDGVQWFAQGNSVGATFTAAT